MGETTDGLAPERVARRRYLTILFSDLSDSTTLAGSIEPEHYLEVLDHLRRCAHSIVPKHGGTIIHFRGDGFLAMFGFPESSESDGRGAIDAALELHEAIRRGPERLGARVLPRLSLHSGIHSGLVLLIEEEQSADHFSLIGDAPNIASRLSDLAKRDEILVSATTLGTERDFFQTRERESLHLDAKSSVSIYQVLERSAVTTRFEARAQRGLTPLIGRAEPLIRLEECLRDILHGRIRTVSIVAAAGLGKTRLAEEFFRRASALGCDIHRGYCESHLSAEPLQPFLQIVRALCKTDVPDLQAELVRASSATGISLGTGTGTAGGRSDADADSSEPLCGLIEAMSRRRPVVLFIDDWQWVDEATRRVVTALRERSHLRLMVLIASRSRHLRDSAMRDAEVIELSPLEDSEATETIRILRPDAYPSRVRQIQELSGGNPLFIEELCHGSPKDRGQDPASRSDEVPAWLKALIESRVSRLPPSQAEIVRVAAIIGNVVPTSLLELTSGCAENDADLRALAANDLLYPGQIPGTLRFKHGITRDVVYDAIGLAERERTHLRIGQLIEQTAGQGSQDEILEQLAYHYRAGAEVAKAARYAELAGDKAMAAVALDRARTQYGASLAALDVLPPTEDTYRRWMSIAQRLGLACVYDPAREQLQFFRRAVELASARGDDVALARAEYWLGYITYALGDVRTAIDQCKRAWQTCEAIAKAAQAAQATELRALSVQILATLGQAHSAACEHDQALTELDVVIDARRRHKGGGRLAAGSAYTLACKGASLGDRGRFRDAHECFAEALEAVTVGNHAVKGSVLNWQAGVYLWQGRWSDALAVGQEAEAIAERIESLYVLGMAHAITAYARWMLDRDPASIDAMVHATSWLTVRDKHLFISANYGWLADALVETGRFDEARMCAARAARRARACDRFGEAMAFRAMARMPPRARRNRLPEHYLRRAMASAKARGSPHEEALTLVGQAQVESARGRRGEAAALLGRAWTAFDAMEMKWHAAKAEQLLLSAT